MKSKIDVSSEISKFYLSIPIPCLFDLGFRPRSTWSLAQKYLDYQNLTLTDSTKGISEDATMKCMMHVDVRLSDQFSAQCFISVTQFQMYLETDALN